MNDQDLDHLLAQRREAPLPSLSANFQHGVWREIRQRNAKIAGRQATWFGWLLEPMFRPGMALAALALALVLGVGLGATALGDSRKTQTRHALNLEVFGSASPSMPSTLIGAAK
jgi:hypothetical protein